MALTPSSDPSESDLRLDDLQDVTVINPSNTDFLAWNGSAHG